MDAGGGRISAEEVLWRRFAVAKTVRTPLPADLLSSAFEPSKKDTDGLSVYQQAKLPNGDPLEIVRCLRPGGKPYALLSLPCCKLYERGIEAIDDPQDDPPPGHALLPSIRWVNEDDQDVAYAEKYAKLHNACVACVIEHRGPFKPHTCEPCE